MRRLLPALDRRQVLVRLLLLALPALRVARSAEAAADAAAPAAFALQGEAQVLAALGLVGPLRLDPRVELDVPEIAEDGAVVPVGVRVQAHGVRRILLLVARNPNTLAADFQPGLRVRPELAIRLKLAESSEVSAIVLCDAGLLAARRSVKVTVGGCGG